MEYNSVLRKNEFFNFLVHGYVKEMHMESILLSEMNQREWGRHKIISLICEITDLDTQRVCYMCLRESKNIMKNSLILKIYCYKRKNSHRFQY